MYYVGEGSGVSISGLTSKVVDLSSISENITIADGYKVKGTLAGDYKISIAAGATVMLEDVYIDRYCE